MTAGATFRGQPLLLLFAILAAWLGMRIALWEPTSKQAAQGSRLIAVPSVALKTSRAPPASRISLAGGSVRSVLNPKSRLWREAPYGPVQVPPLPAQPDFEPTLSPMDLPPALMAHVQEGAARPGVPAAAPALVAVPTRTSVPEPRRWAADGWLLLRHDTTSPILSGRPSYGRSQAGAVVRYGLAPLSPLRPLVFLRASTALAGARDQEVAAGFSARPLPVAPLRVVAEVRAGETHRGTRLRFAAYAVTELPPLDLPLRARAEAYLQGGYVGGEFATAFVDAQARVERTIGRLGETELSAGAGVWGGAQDEAARFDAGPSAAIVFRLGEGRGRLAADYRFRIAGEAEPSSGPALTLSAGF
jgi:hypothetical protein